MYAYFTYIRFGMSYTAINIPYGSLASVMTDDTMFRSYGAVAASLTLNTVISLLVFDENRIARFIKYYRLYLML